MPDGPDEKLMPLMGLGLKDSLSPRYSCTISKKLDESCTGRCHFLFLFSRFFCVATFRRRTFLSLKMRGILAKNRFLLVYGVSDKRIVSWSINFHFFPNQQRQSSPFRETSHPKLSGRKFGLFSQFGISWYTCLKREKETSKMSRSAANKSAAERSFFSSINVDTR